MKIEFDHYTPDDQEWHLYFLYQGPESAVGINGGMYLDRAIVRERLPEGGCRIVDNIDRNEFTEKYGINERDYVETMAEGFLIDDIQTAKLETHDE